MRNPVLFIFSLLFIAGTICAQEKTSIADGLLFHIKSGLYLGNSQWSFKHPIISGNSTKWETVEGESSGGIFYEVGLERRINRLGLMLNFGTKPSQITVFQGQSISVEHTYNFNTNYAELGLNYYFNTTHKKIKPYTGVDIGFIKLTGDSKTNGFSLNYGGGICWLPSDKICLYVGIDGKLIYYINYVESELSNEVYDRTIHLLSFVASLGVSYNIKWSPTR